MASGSETRQLPQVLAFRVTDAEREVVRGHAAHAGLSPGGYLRSLVCALPVPRPRRQRQPVKDGEALARVLAHLGKIGSNVNQLAHAAHLGTGPEVRMLAEACADIRTMRDLLMRALGAQGRDG